MSVTVTCECGHVTELADSDHTAGAAVVADAVCPACGRPLTKSAPVGKRMFQQLWQSHVGDAVTPAVPSPPTVALPVDESVASEPSKPRRSLWDVMRGATVAPPAKAPATTEPTADVAKPKGLWGLMHNVPPVESLGSPSVLVPSAERGRSPDEGSQDAGIPQPIGPFGEVNAPVVADSASVPIGDGQRPPYERPTSPTTTELTLEQKYAQAASLASMTHVATSWQPEPAAEPFAEEDREWSRRAVTALTFAVVTILVAAASYRPEWWWRGLALSSGLVAVLLGFVATADVRQSRGRLKGQWVARSSVLVGALGMFLAPLVFARLGERQRENAGRSEIEWRLRRIGEGLNRFHDRQNHFPEAAIKGRDAHDDIVPMHGWMTPLLPTLGQDAVYRRIDLKLPFDSAVNVPAMQQQIPEYSLPRRKPARSPRGFGLTHFSGVGGQDRREPAGLVHFGMFNDSLKVKREHFTDGLSQTIVVGEIRDRDPPAPPWGEPGNVRSIGGGLNRQFRGFGNANGTGATFLHADGSVKFYSNKTDRRVLERLETRDGAEPE